MNILKYGFLTVLATFSFSALTCTKNGQEGFLPKNDLWISADSKGILGITAGQFNAVIDKVEAIYAPIVSSYGGELQVERRWSDGTVNAYAEQDGAVWKVSMFGGLARHRAITEDGFALVVCHEIGHHIGGAPKYSSDEWATNEGQADYFATLKCLRRVWMSDNNEQIVSNLNAPETLTEACAKSWTNKNDRALCIRGAMAGDSVAQLFAALGRSRIARFDTPDTKIVSQTYDSHPATQCRLDTYFQGALCELSFNDDVSQNDEVSGTCHASTGQALGLRPRCWFSPSR